MFLLLLLHIQVAAVTAFVVHKPYRAIRPTFPWTRKGVTIFQGLHEKVDPTAVIDELSVERRTNLYQSLLRDLQIEGVPLLGCDAVEVHTMMAAAWTIMSELSAQDDGQSACLILEEIPMDAIRSFADDFADLKTQQQRLMDHLPELGRFNVTLLGEGIGPALVIETANRTSSSSSSKAAAAATKEEVAVKGEFQSIAALKVFAYRMFSLQHDDFSEKDGGISYRYSGSSDVCAVLAGFWNCVCELFSPAAQNQQGTFYSIPAVASHHDRFAAVSELLSRSLCLYRGNDVFELSHYHPSYDRDLIEPKDSPAFGHVPPKTWLADMMQETTTSSPTEAEIALSDYQRRSPHTAVLIQKHDASLFNKPGDAAVDLTLASGEVVKASGMESYSRILSKLMEEGQETLQTALEKEIAI